MGAETRIPWGLLDLAKHAPHDMPDWFMPIMPPMKNEPTTEDRAAWREYHKEFAEWQNESIKQRAFQWPIAWAQGVLEGAEKLGVTEPEPIDPRIKLAEETLTKVLGFLGLNPGEKFHDIDKQVISQLIKETIKSLQAKNE